MGAKKRKPTPGSEPRAAELPELPERWSAAWEEPAVYTLRLRGRDVIAYKRR